PALGLHRQRNRSRHLRTGLFSGAHDVGRGLVEHLVIERLQANTDLLRHRLLDSGLTAALALRLPYFRILVTTPAPTVRPPSRMAKRSPSSIAIGVMSSIFIWMLSPGITISTPSGSSTDPVTSVVRK